MRLEGYAQGHLNLSWSLLDIDDLAELRISDCVDRVAMPRPVQDIEHVAAELDIFALPEGESLVDAKAFRRQIGAPEVAEVARGIAQS